MKTSYMLKRWFNKFNTSTALLSTKGAWMNTSVLFVWRTAHRCLVTPQI